ncbi:uncharacterized protein TRUGW13939_08018 [Talaromyces rugulosus]|uniref:Protein kinase domain-containing protein n=1 Tax=Talaromyces rugulosus TaxID=121627 RepID=A0A7H8R3I0_TALRU|nr:uncharacterized protein TRUGW13939_08018 [Talaromyces rugulosus]QKX60872.1 hypothetical protein TRUGW13939_08018 [Talaromyces rugulosus]
MDIQRQKFPNVHWICWGGISFTYEVHPRIVVKAPRSGEFEGDQFRKELEIHQIFSESPPCPFIVQCIHVSEKGIFLEYMRDKTLNQRMQGNHIMDRKTMIVTKVEKLEPLPLRKEWMNDLAQAIAFLESLGLAHGDLRPDNILIDRDRLKLSDFDCTANFGSYHEACTPPYGRLLNETEAEEGARGTSGSLGPRTEQFALGSIYYYINYGFEVYGDRCLTEDPREHGPKAVDLLINMEFPTLNGNSRIDDIIYKCWHNKYATISGLAADTKALLDEEPCTGSNGEGNSTEENNREEKTEIEDPSGDGFEGFPSKKEFCQDLEKRGLVDLLCSGEPKDIGFKFEWYRHSLGG